MHSVNMDVSLNILQLNTRVRCNTLRRYKGLVVPVTTPEFHMRHALEPQDFSKGRVQEKAV